MKCPNDNETLLMTERSGIEIDYCPKCRGVWLDRGELDKLLEKNSSQIEGEESVDDMRRAPQDYRSFDERRYDTGYIQKHNKSHKRESFLGDLFDF
jgi:Zn-finger nucleic acid-binding protein